jgi:hypothetical protein
MNNPTIPDVSPKDDMDVVSKSPGPHRVEGIDRSISIERVRSTCRSLEVFGTWLGWGLTLLGLLSTGERALGMVLIGVYGSNLIDWIGGIFSLAYMLTAYSLAGLGTFVLSRFLAAVVTGYFEHSFLDSQNHAEQVDCTVAVIERLATTLESWNAPVAAGSVSADRRTSSLAEIEGAIRASLWDQATTLLDDFAAEFPDDPALAGVRQNLANARKKAQREQFAQLEAAREVNDPERVLEIYHALVPSLEIEARISLDRELAKWFMTLIHRRLRTGTIQTEVVQLASRIAEVFSSTMEGASVRAALPTLRRSVGLCPRCSQPYAGLAEACPNCLTAGTS